MRLRCERVVMLPFSRDRNKYHLRLLSCAGNSSLDYLLFRCSGE